MPLGDKKRVRYSENEGAQVIPAGFHGLDAEYAEEHLLGGPDGGIALVLGFEISPDVGISNALESLGIGADQSLLQVVDEALAPI